METRENEPLVGVVFTGAHFEQVRQWVQDRAAQREIVATPSRLYLPVLSNNMAVVEEGDTIWFDPEIDGPNAFSVERA